MNTQQPSNPDASQLDFGRVLPILAVVLIAGFGGWSYFTSRMRTQEAEEKLAEQTKANVDLQQKMANMESMMQDLKTAKLYEEQEQAISAANALGVLEQGDLIRATIDELGAQLLKLQQRLEELESSDAGRKLAASQELVEQYSVATSVTIPSKNLAANLGERLNRVLSAPQKALAENIAGYVPSSTLLNTVGDIEEEASQALSVVNSLLTDLESLEHQARNLAPNESQTLGQILSGLEQAKQEQRRQQMNAAIQAAEDEAARKLAEQEAENRLKIAEAERKAAQMLGEETAAKILADAEAMKKEIDSAKAERAAAEAKAQLLREYNADLPQIKLYLKAFTTDGRKMRKGGSGPASLSYLIGEGALAETDEGLDRLLALGAYYNDRPKGALPEYFSFNSRFESSMNEKISMVEKAQKLLIKYGALMVENGMLAE
ncbi:MAG: hypothetical protein ACE361_26220 [Aureliella sp.]